MEVATRAVHIVPNTYNQCSFSNTFTAHTYTGSCLHPYVVYILYHESSADHIFYALIENNTYNIKYQYKNLKKLKKDCSLNSCLLSAALSAIFFGKFI